MTSIKMTPEQHTLVVDNLRLVNFAWKRIYKTRLLLSWKEDLFQEGYYALCYAAVSFDPSLGFNFSTYAYKCIRHRLVDIIEWLYKRVYLDVSGNTYSDKEEERGFTLLDLIPSEVEDYEKLENILDARYLIEQLNDRDRTIMEMWVDGKTSYEISEVVNLSPGSVRDYIVVIRKRLKKMYEEGVERKSSINYHITGDHLIDKQGRYRSISTMRSTKWKRYRAKIAKELELLNEVTLNGTDE